MKKPEPTMDIPPPVSLAETIRSLKVGESIVLPQHQFDYVHRIGRKAGHKIKTARVQGTDTIRAWRIQ